MKTVSGKRKIAVLGGGAASLFAVWDLVHSDPEAYDITVYQMGWRIGGKGASGRNARLGYRIEEHGLHLLFGFYENVFRVMREAYAECYPAHPGLWRSFFKTADTEVSMIKFLDGKRIDWEPWVVPYPQVATDLPGDPVADETTTVRRILENLLRWIGGALLSALPGQRLVEDFVAVSLGRDALRRRIDALKELDIRGTVDSFARLEWLKLEPMIDRFVTPWWELAQAQVAKLAPGAPADPSDQHEKDVRRFGWLIDRVGALLKFAKPRLGATLYAMLAFTGAVARGLFVDLFIRNSSNWFELDTYDFGDWIERHGGDRSSPVVVGLYDAVFGTYSAIGAGTILQASMKAAFLFRGGAVYKMYAGMGDTMFTPLYLALTKRGVKFEFFHRIEALGLSEDRTRVETIAVERQAKLKRGTYDPLVDVDVSIGPLTTLRCWPSEPNWDQIADDDRTRLEGTIDLENYWTPPAPDRQLTLQRGVDFDDVILGISVAALPTLCPDLLAEDPAFADHVMRLAPTTTATQAFQLWWVRGRKPTSPRPIVVPFDEPYDTIADMSHLLAAEPGSAELGGIHYLCSAIKEESPVSPRSHEHYPAALRESARRNALEWMNNRAPVLWPQAFEWSALHDPNDGIGAARFDAQFVSTPINLSDRYVVPVPMSAKYRLLSNGTKFTNLYITGDWIRTSLSVGCVEAAAMSGIQAARALSLEAGTRPVARARGDWIEDVTPRPPAARQAPAPPRFRKRDGEVIAPPPYEIICPNLLMFVLRADVARLERLCDHELNLGHARYSPIGPYVVLYAATLDTFSTGIKCRASEVGFWVPLVVSANGSRSLRTYSPYVWLDSPTSTLSGRSVFGYAKHLASVDVPPRDAVAAGIAVTGEALVSSAGSELWSTSRQQLLSAHPNTTSDGVVSNLRRHVELANSLADVVRLSPADLIEMVRGMRSVFLKQLPAAAGPSASYQALVETNIVPHLDTVRGAPLGRWTIKIPAHHEPSIVDTLGLEAEQTFDPATMKRMSIIRPLAQMWMSFHGRVDPGEETWTSGVPGSCRSFVR